MTQIGLQVSNSAGSRAPWSESASSFARGSGLHAPSAAHTRRQFERHGTSVSAREARKARRRARVDGFDEQFSALVDLICSAAHLGLRPWHEQEYAGHRRRLGSHYRSVERLLSPFWDHEAGDPFLMLFSPASVEQTIHSAESLSAIYRAREALAACSSWLDAAQIG